MSLLFKLGSTKSGARLRRSRSVTPPNSQAYSSNNHRRVLVVGAGAIGLRTALELVRRNVQVIVTAARHPSDTATCSMGAGGLWMPYHVEDERVGRWALETLDELWSDYVSKQSKLVEIIPNVYFKSSHSGPKPLDFQQKYDNVPGQHTQAAALPTWTRDPRLAFQHMSIHMLEWQNLEHKIMMPPLTELLEAGYEHCWFFRPPVVDCPNMLNHLLEEVSQHAQVDVKSGSEFHSMEQMKQRALDLGCDTLVNCTGLGAAALCNDDQIVGARGILLHYDRKTCVRRMSFMHTIRERSYSPNVNEAILMTDEKPWGSEKMPCYLIPRGDTILVGGSYLEGDKKTKIRDKEREQLVRNAARLGIDTEESHAIGEWIGFRPVRSKVRCELDPSHSDVTVFHSYGYGGSGWTVNVGAAKECADTLLGKQNLESPS